METSVKEGEEYERRAKREMDEAEDHLKNRYLETAASTAYYSCFYAVHAQLARLGIAAKSHKQIGIQFRRHFIKTKKMDVKYSRIWATLAQWRSEVDYTALPPIDEEKAKQLVQMARNFVNILLKIKS